MGAVKEGKMGLSDLDIIVRYQNAEDKKGMLLELSEKTGKTVKEIREILRAGGIDGRTIPNIKKVEPAEESNADEPEFEPLPSAPERADEWTDEDIDREAFRAELQEIFREPGKRKFRITMDSATGIRLTGETGSIARLYDMIRESYDSYEEYDSIFEKLAELAFGQRDRLSLPWSYEIEAVEDEK